MGLYHIRLYFHRPAGSGWHRIFTPLLPPLYTDDTGWVRLYCRDYFLNLVLEEERSPSPIILAYLNGFYNELCKFEIFRLLSNASFFYTEEDARFKCVLRWPE